MKLTRTGVLNDTHGPWHCESSLNLVLDIFEDQNLDRIVLNGDILDMYNVNSHSKKDPMVQTLLEDELAWGRDFIANLRKRFPTQHIVYIYGNHEDRLDRYIIQNAKPFWNLLTIDKQLELDRHNIEWLPYNNEYQLEDTKLYIQHSPPSYSVNFAMTALKKKMDASYIYGCTHRMDFAAVTGKFGQYEVWGNGWLGSTNATPEHERIFKYTKGHSNWQKCAMLVTIADGTEYFVEQFPIRESRGVFSAVVSGHYYEI